jgi:hypothetical protein
MKPPSMVLALLLLLGVAVLCAQRWGHEAGHAACAGQVQALQGALQRQNVAVYALREEEKSGPRAHDRRCPVRRPVRLMPRWQRRASWPCSRTATLAARQKH